MSRIGKQPIKIPEGATINVADDFIVVKGPKGELKRKIGNTIQMKVTNKEAIFSPAGGDADSGTSHLNPKKISALWGLYRSLVANMVKGVMEGFEKKLEFEGVGYRAALEGDALVMQLGFSHPVRLKAPSGIKITVEKNTITVSGIDKEAVGETAARIRGLKPTEPYKGKGIRYRGEVIRRKTGKKAVASA